MTHTAVRFVLTISDILTCMQIYPNIVDSLRAWLTFDSCISELHKTSFETLP